MQKIMKKIVAEYADGTPSGIQLYFASRLERLTKAILWLTVVLSILAILQIILIVRN